MLCFSRRDHAHYEGASGAPTPEQLNARATCTLQVPAADVPLQVARRERFLTALAVDYVCRWRVATSGCATTTNTAAGCDDTAAFYAAMDRVDAAHRAPLIAPNRAAASIGAIASAKPLGDDNLIEIVDAGTACAAAAYLHDWTRDASQKQYFVIKNRTHVLVKYAHPCNDGHTLVHLSESDAACAHCSVAPAAATAGAGRLEKRDALMTEMMRVVRQRGASGEDVVTAVEKTRQMRADELQAARDQLNAEADQRRAASKEACARMLARARDAAGGGGTSDDDVEEEEEEEEEEQPDEDVWQDDDDGGGGGDSSTDTFSSSSEEEEEEEETSVGALRLRRRGPSPQKRTYADAVRGGGLKTIAEETPADFLQQEEEAVVDAPSPVVSVEVAAHAVETAVVATPLPRKPRAVRQSTVEMMVPVCEAGDTLAFFDELECPFVLQWAAETEPRRRQRLHVFRKQVHEQRGWFGNARRVVYSVIATIEALPAAAAS